jgi:hypothetical protein
MSTTALYKTADTLLTQAFEVSLNTFEKKENLNDPLASRLWPMHRDRCVRIATCVLLLAKDSGHTYKEQVQILMRACFKSRRPKGMKSKIWRRVVEGFIRDIFRQAQQALQMMEAGEDDEP